MRPRIVPVLLLSVLVLAVGCAAKRSCFDCVEPGMTRHQVIRLMGMPLNVSRNAMHWQQGEYTDAWVFFDANGKLVTGKYWQAPRTLRLDEIWPLLPEGYTETAK
jgi:hypothetical protein